MATAAKVSQISQFEVKSSSKSLSDMQTSKLESCCYANFVASGG